MRGDRACFARLVVLSPSARSACPGPMVTERPGFHLSYPTTSTRWRRPSWSPRSLRRPRRIPTDAGTSLVSTYSWTMPKSKVRRSQSRSGRSRTRWHPASTILQLEPTGLPRILFPADVAQSTAPDFTTLDLDFVIASPKKRELMRLPLRFERRWRSGLTIDLWGSDLTGAISVHLQAFEGKTWTVGMGAALDSFTASQAWALMRLAEFLKEPNQLAFTQRASKPEGFSPITVQAAPSPPPEGLYEVIQALVKIEKQVGVPVRLPETIPPEVNQSIQVAASLLDGNVVTDQWDRLDLPMTVSQVRRLADSVVDQPPGTLQMMTAWHLDLDDEQRFEIGPISALYHAVRIAAIPKTEGLADDETVNVAFEPADDERIVDLRYAPESNGVDADAVREGVDDPVTYVPSALFDELIASLDTPEEPTLALADAFAQLRDRRG